MRWPLIRRKTLDRALRNQRRNLVGHLRQNPRGLVLLDNVMVRECELPEVIVLGEYAMITNNYIGPQRDTQ